MKKKLDEQTLNEIFPDEELRQNFMQREDIAMLPKDEQEQRWQKQKKGIARFFALLSGTDGYVVPGERR